MAKKMDESKILASIQNHYIPFLKRLIAHVEKKSDKKSSSFDKIKYVHQVFTESDKKEKLEAYHACKDMLDKWHKRYKDMKIIIDKKPEDGDVSSNEPTTSADSKSSKSTPDKAQTQPNGSASTNKIVPPTTGASASNKTFPTAVKKEGESSAAVRVAIVQPQAFSVQKIAPAPSSTSTTEKKKDGDESGEMEFVCASCQFRTKDEVSFMKHTRSDHRSDLSLWCKQCGKCFSNAGVLVSHIKEKNCEKEEMIYRCGVKECTFETSSGQTFVHHLRHCHKGSPFIFCIHCQKIFTLPHCLILHMQNECPFKDKNRKNPGSSSSSNDEPVPATAANPAASSQLSVSQKLQKQLAAAPAPKEKAPAPSKPVTNSYKPVQISTPPPSLAKRGGAARGGGVGRGRGRKRIVLSESSDSEDPDDPSWKPEESDNLQPRRRSARWAKKVTESQNPDLFESEDSVAKKNSRLERPKQNEISCPCCNFTAVYESVMKDHYIMQHKDRTRNSCLVCNVKFESKQLFLDHFRNHEEGKSETKKSDDATAAPDLHDVDSSDSREARMDTSDTSNSKAKTNELNVRNLDFSASGVKVPYQTAIQEKQHEKKIKTFEDLKYHGDVQKMKTETKLKHFYKCVVEGCVFTTDDSVFYITHLTERHAGKSLNCVYCFNDIASARELAEHMLEEHGIRCYQCSLCFYRASCKPHVQMHMRNVHKEKGVVYTCSTHLPPDYKFKSEPDSSNLTTTWPYLCAIGDCNYQAYDPKDFRKHNESEHRSVSMYFCYYCKVDFISFKKLMTHYHLHGINQYQCTFCIHGTETRDEMLLHMAISHADKPLKVHIRSAVDSDSTVKTYSNSEKVVSSEKVQRQSNPQNANTNSNHRIICELPKLVKELDKEIFCRLPFCEQKFDNLVKYARHLKLSHAASNILCPYCSSVFDDGKTFANHVVCHGPNLYSCKLDNCGYYSFSENDVTKHMSEDHKTEKAVAKTIRGSADFTLTPEKLSLNDLIFEKGTYVCMFCYMRTSNSNDMKNHIYMELNYKRFVCNLCKTKCHSRKDAFIHFSENHSHHNIKCNIDTNLEIEYFTKFFQMASVQNVIQKYIDCEGMPLNPVISQLTCFKDTYSCGSCTSAFHTIREEQFHLKMCLQKDYMPFLCTHCDTKVKDFISLKNHSGDCHKDLPVSYTAFRNQFHEEQNGRNIQVTRVDFFVKVLESLLLDKNQITAIRDKTYKIEQKIYNCGYCKFSDSFRSNVEKHGQGCHKDKTLNVDKVSPKFELPTTSLKLIEEVDSSAVRDGASGDKSTKRYMCGFCNKKTCTLQELGSHNDVQHSDRKEKIYSYFYWPDPLYQFSEMDTTLFECAYCSVSQENLYHLKRHCNNLHSEVPFKVRGKSSIDEPMARCKHCDYKAASFELIEKHRLVNHSKGSDNGALLKRKASSSALECSASKSIKKEAKNTCDVCDTCYEEKADLDEHIRTRHTFKFYPAKSSKDDSLILHTCNVCNYIAEERLLYEHVTESHKGYVGCKYCKHYFETVLELESHSKDAHRGLEVVVIKAEDFPSSSVEQDDNMEIPDNESSSTESTEKSNSEDFDLERIVVKLPVAKGDSPKVPVKYLSSMFNIFPSVKVADVMKNKKNKS